MAMYAIQFVELVGKRLGLVGFGRVGSEVSRRAVGLGMEVVAFDPYVSPERAAQLEAFDEIDRRMQVVGETPSQRAARIVLETIRQR